jgi:dTDP-glucose 4,6-dehydratase/UDP-glucose 4-epimerase
MKKEILLVVGSEGFIGSSVLKFFSKNYEVYSCDFIDVRGRKNYFQLNPTKQTFNEIFQKSKFSLVINCAGSANVSGSIINPIFDFEANVEVVANLLSAILVSNRCVRLINISSAAVYGNFPLLPIRTEYAERAVQISPYGVHKKIAESLMEKYYSSFNIRCCSLRVFSAYGEGQRKLLLWDLFKKFSEGRSIELFGTGSESRDYIHIDDICQQLQLVLENANFRGEAYNIANGEEVFVKDVAGLFSSCFQNRKFEFNGLVREGDPLNWKADISVMRDWGYKQTVPIEIGVNRYIQWAKENG